MRLRFFSVVPLALAALPVLLAPAVAAACAKVTQRREWRQLSDPEQAAYIAAVKAAQLRQSPTQPSVYDKLVQMHVLLSAQIHSVAAFLPWHRFYLFLFEKVLQKVSGNPDLFVPYWNWALDSQTPDLAEIWGDNEQTEFGRDGDPAADFCVSSGAFRGWKPMYPTPHCLRRKWTEPGRIGALYSPENLMAAASTAVNYAAFRPSIEGAPHASVHINIGGAVGDMAMMHSPNDPVFFLHHAYVDFLWAQWQKRKAPDRYTDYGGPVVKGGPAVATLEDPLPGFAFTRKADGVRVVLKIKHAMNIDSLCYNYVNTDRSILAGNGAQQFVQLVRRRAPLLMRRAPDPVPDADAAPAAGNLVTVTENVQPPPPTQLNACSRKYINLLLAPIRINTLWCEMNGFAVEDMRRMEDEHYKVVDQINQLDGYTSPACASNQLKRLQALLGAVKTFVLYAGGKQILVEQDPATAANPAAAVQGIIQRSKTHCPSKTLQAQPADVRDQLAAIIGDYQGDPNAADNPWRPRDI
jgi:tyrosinase